jgi:hypothetical protein
MGGDVFLWGLLSLKISAYVTYADIYDTLHFVTQTEFFSLTIYFLQHLLMKARRRASSWSRSSSASKRRTRRKSTHPQPDPQPLLSWASHHVLSSLARQSAPRIEMGLHARVHWVRGCHNLDHRRGVPACIQGHPEHCAGRETSDPTERCVHEFDLYGCGTLVGGYAWAVYLRFSHLCESFVYVFSVFSFY